jgi:putative transposase
MSNLKSYKYRLYPTENQAKMLQWTLDRCRELYNAALEERREAWKMSRVSVTYNMQAAELPEIKELRPEYKEIHSQVLQDTLRRVDKGMKAFFRRVKAGEKPGFPRFQGKGRFDSFTYPQVGFALENGKLQLSKIGHIKVKQHRPVQGTIKTATIKREGEHWYVVLVCEGEKIKRTPYTDEAIGIDLGVMKLATLSNGDVIENPKHYRKSQEKLARAQQKLAKKKKWSNRRRKAAKAVGKVHRKIRNQRNDYLQKHSRWLVDTYETIVFEDIKPANLSKAPKAKQDEDGNFLPNGASAKAGLNKSILDAGWSQFIRLCEYKAANAGTVQVIRVDPKYTSQACSGCGKIVKKTLDERWHSCECGCELDRDHNAAKNILRLGRSQRETVSLGTFQGTAA